MHTEVSAQAGAEYGEPSPPPQWLLHPNLGHQGGTMDLHIPKIRGCYSPALPEPRRRSERALPTAIQQGCQEGVSTRRADDSVSSTGQALIKASGCDGISKPVVGPPKGARCPASAKNWPSW